MTASGRTVLVPAGRAARWFENFEKRHGPYTTVLGESLRATAEDGTVAVVCRPFDLPPVEVGDLGVLPPVRWGLVLVRRGGFAVAAGTGPTPALTKVGKRHVQGQTKAGGWSQQRFARRRDNQAAVAFEAAADHAHRILVQEFGGVDHLVLGGDRKAADAVLEDPRLRGLVDKVTDPWLAVRDPKADVLAKAVGDAWSLRIEVREPPTELVLP